MSTATRTALTPEEFLIRERLADERSIYLDGEVIPMPGASRQHNRIAVNLCVLIGNQLVDRDCELYLTDMRVWVPPARMYCYPDLVVVRGEPRFLDGEFDNLLNPTLIVEILSPSTQALDRGAKFAGYRLLESLQQYVLIRQDRVGVELYTRHGDAWDRVELDGPAEILVLDSIGCAIPLADIYAKVRFDPGAGPA